MRIRDLRGRLDGLDPDDEIMCLDGSNGCVVRTVVGEWTVRGLTVSIARKHLDAGKRQEG